MPVQSSYKLQLLVHGHVGDHSKFGSVLHDELNTPEMRHQLLLFEDVLVSMV